MFRTIFKLLALRYGQRLLSRYFANRSARGAAGQAARTRRY
jgi:hypothetical protein